MERIVEAKIETYMPEYEGCSCETCINDIKCLALNKLPSKYVNSQEGELFSRVDQVMFRQNCVDLDIAVVSAIEAVKSKPRCENSKK
ncbi:MAG: late competence development ComFB family protein [Oscillospiraceae bacterium]|nr:late competence development ComFB family protein [Oscillospiraceae bacterium]